METVIDISDLGIKMPEKKDKNGKRIIDAPKITTAVILNKEIEVIDWVRDVETSYGKGRYALEIEFYGGKNKLIVNSPSMKQLIDAFEQARVTRFKAVVIDKGGSHFEFSHVKILEIDKRPVAKTEDGKLIYTDTNEVVDLTKFNNKKEETKQ